MPATLTRTTYPIHSWVLFFLVALCLAFGLYPFPEQARRHGQDLSRARPAANAPAVLSEIERVPPGR